MVIKKYDIVTVTWIDSEAVDGWQSKYEYVKYPDEEMVPVYSVGIVYGETEECVTLVGSVSRDQVMNLLRIPKVAITSVVPIGVWTDEHAFSG